MIRNKEFRGHPINWEHYQTKRILEPPFKRRRRPPWFTWFLFLVAIGACIALMSRVYN